MKKLLLLVVTLLSASFMSAQTMKEIPVQKRFHTMSENGKYMITNDQAYVGIYNTETDEFDEYYDGMKTNYQIGMGNIVTNDGFLVGAVDGQEMDTAGTEGRRPAIFYGKRHNAFTQIYSRNSWFERNTLRKT